MSFYQPSSFEPDCSIGYLVRRIHQLGQAALEPVFAAEGITAIQWSALASIYFERGRTSTELARDLAHDKGAMTRLVDTLAERGLITRCRDEGDRRTVNLSLTEEGRAVAERCRTGVIRCWNGWLQDWNGDEVQDLINKLQRLRRVVDASDGGCA